MWRVISPTGGKAMNGFSDWIQSYWFQLGSLLLQFATLTALMWFARKILRMVMTSQKYAESRHSTFASPTEPAAEAQPFSSGLRGLIPMDGAPSQPRAQDAYLGSGGSGLWDSILKWLNTPMGNAPVAWRRWAIRRVYSV
jgi:hypothetical protein